MPVFFAEEGEEINVVFEPHPVRDLANVPVVPFQFVLRNQNFDVDDKLVDGDGGEGAEGAEASAFGPETGSASGAGAGTDAEPKSFSAAFFGGRPRRFFTGAASAPPSGATVSASAAAAFFAPRFARASSLSCKAFL